MIPAVAANRIGSMTESHLAKIDAFAVVAKLAPQENIVTEHIFHGGMYSRTIRLKADMVIIGTLIKIPTMIFVSGDVVIYAEEGPIEISGAGVIPASAGTKRAILTRTDATLTMTFPTDARTVAEAEAQFTDDLDDLMSHQNENIIIVTGE